MEKFRGGFGVIKEGEGFAQVTGIWWREERKWGDAGSGGEYFGFDVIEMDAEGGS